MKKTIYIICWVSLTLMLSFMAHAWIEMAILKKAQATGAEIVWNRALGIDPCALPVWLIYLLPILGIAIGLWAGFFFWQKVYVEHLNQKN